MRPTELCHCEVKVRLGVVSLALAWLRCKMPRGLMLVHGSVGTVVSGEYLVFINFGVTADVILKV